MDSKFEYFEIVKIKDTSFTRSQKINLLEGVILGMSKDQPDEWGYAVHIYDLEEVWDLREELLSATGKMTTKEEFYDGTSITIKVDPETGEGDIVE